MELNKIEIGKRISNIRKELGLTMEEFGKIVEGAQKSNVSKWEHGHSIPSNSRLKKIAKLGGVSATWLLHGDSFEEMTAALKNLYSQSENTAKEELITITQKDLTFEQSNFIVAVSAIINYIDPASGLYEVLPDILLSLGRFDQLFPAKIDQIINQFDLFTSATDSDKIRIDAAKQIFDLVYEYIYSNNIDLFNE